MINITADLINHKDFQLCLEKMPERFTDVLLVSLNKAAVTFNSITKKETMKKWNLPTEATKNYKVKKASLKTGYMDAQVILESSRINPMKLSPSQTEPMTGKTTGGVSFYLRGKPRPESRGFIANIKGTVNMFRVVREGKGDGPYKRTSTGKPALERITVMPAPLMTISEKENIDEMALEKAQIAFNNEFIAQCEGWLITEGFK